MRLLVPPIAAALVLLLGAPGARALEGELRALVGEPVPLGEIGSSGLGSFRRDDGPGGAATARSASPTSPSSSPASGPAIPAPRA